MKIKTYFLSFLMLSSLLAHAGWEVTNGPLTGWPQSLVKNGSTIYLGTTQGIFQTNDLGSTWTYISSTLNTKYPSVNDLTIIGSELYVASNDQYVYRTTDNGATWTSLYTGTSSSTLCITTDGTNLYIGTLFGAFSSSNKGGTWIAINNGLGSFRINTLLVNGSNLFAGTDKGVFVSSNSGANWTQKNNGLADTTVQSMAASGSNVYAGTANGVYVTTDNGTTWSDANAGLFGKNVTDLYAEGSNVYAATHDAGIYVSTNNGNLWVNKNTVGSSATVVMASGSAILAGFVQRGMFKSTNGGTNWNQSNTGLTAAEANQVLQFGGTLYAGTAGSGIFFSNDEGNTWTDMKSTGYCPSVHVIASDGPKLYFGSSGLYVTPDNAQTWSKVFTPFIDAAAAGGSDLYVGTILDGAYHSGDAGSNWTQVNNGFTDLHVYNLGVYGSVAFAATTNSNAVSKSFRSTDKGATWVPITDFPSGFECFLVKGSDIFVAVIGYGIYVSSDAGATWTRKVTGLTDQNFTGLTTNGTHLFVTTYSGKFFVSSNNGNNWTQVPGALPYVNNTSLAASANYVFISTYGASVWRRPVSEMIVGIDEVTDNRFSIYPNPSSASFTISAEKSFVNATINVFNTIGEKVYSSLVEDEQTTIHSNLPSGIYFIHITTAENQFTQKIVIE